MRNPSQTIAKLRAHAAGSGPEAQIAKDVLASMGVAADAPSEEMGYLECQGDGSWHHIQLFANICEYLGVEPMNRKDRRSIMLAHGPKSMCAAAVELFLSMKKQLAELHRGTTIGFILGSLSTAGQREGKQAKPLDADALAVARLTMNIGSRNNPRRLLPSKG